MTAVRWEYQACENVGGARGAGGAGRAREAVGRSSRAVEARQAHHRGRPHRSEGAGLSLRRTFNGNYGMYIPIIGDSHCLCSPPCNVL